jgi:hypothetical protein
MYLDYITTVVKVKVQIHFFVGDGCMKTVRVAAGAGYSGDRIDPALDIIRSKKAQYMIFECLAERTIALSQKEKLENCNGGYNPLLNYRMEQVIPLLSEHPLKIVTNMGAANPIAAAQRIAEIAIENGLGHLRIAAVEGDDVFDLVMEADDLVLMETNEQLSKMKDKIISANAYIGASCISRALSEGADIVVTGRVADSSLVTGPLMYEFDSSYENYDFLGKTIVAGHLLECAGQVTGGYFADPGKKDVPELWNLGFPILTFHEDGSMILEKLQNTGGLLDTRTVKEQLLYEVQDPANYLTPDVIADFSRVHVEQMCENIVRVTGASGKKRTGTLKVSVCYLDGWIGTGEISYGGQNCIARAKLAEETIKHRIAKNTSFQPGEMRSDLLGVNSLYGSFVPSSGIFNEVRLRMAVRTDTEEQAAIIGREIEALYTNGPAGGGGVRSSTTKVISVVNVLLPENKTKPKITWVGG